MSYTVQQIHICLCTGERKRYFGNTSAPICCCV